MMSKICGGDIHVGDPCVYCGLTGRTYTVSEVRELVELAHKKSISVHAHAIHYGDFENCKHPECSTARAALAKFDAVKGE